MKYSLENLIEITNQILRTKYANSKLAFLAGSYVRGEATAFSDFDWFDIGINTNALTAILRRNVVEVFGRQLR